MLIEFDPAKDVLNRANHPMSLAFASELDWDSALVWLDKRFEFDEFRMIALAPETNTVYHVPLLIAARRAASSAYAAPPQRGESICPEFLVRTSGAP